MKIYYLLFNFYHVLFCFSNPTVTFDEFFDYTTYPFLSFSSNDEYLLFHSRYPLWNNNSYSHNLWIYNIENKQKILITENLHPSIKPKWSPTGNYIALTLNNDQNLYLYSVQSNELVSIRIGNETIPLGFTWSKYDFSFYLVALTNKEKNVIEFQINDEISTIFEINFDRNQLFAPININFIKNISFLINEIIYVPSVDQLVFTSVRIIMENIEDFEIYSINLQNSSFLLVKLTNNEAIEEDLQLSIDDSNEILFRTLSLCSTKKQFNDTQGRLYSMNLINGNMKQIGKHFSGNIIGYANQFNGNILILGQLGTQVHIYTKQLLKEDLIHHHGWNGTYESIVISNKKNLIAFVHSSFNKPMEIYFIDNIDELNLAKSITNNNQLFIQRNLPQGIVYTWTNQDDNQTIEGILHYPPDKFQSKNLPLLVLIHGGPYYASVNHLNYNGGYWAPLAATQGWLVLEPNYRGSTGYGDEFLNQIRHRPLSLPGNDILFGIDNLIRDGLVDSKRLAVGGYSYGGFLTNWLITQTQRFNVALSGSGAIDLSSTWGMLDMPVLIENLFGGFPWNVPDLYKNESPIYYLDKVRTPTHIVTGEIDTRVPSSQSYIFERALYSRGIPVQLITFPNEGHALNNNPWHQKIKVREELKWLHKYGNQISQ
ncbi:hypothetical protein I4U23_015915 [Adineta vaga]|nr:hypothetical protein I4U23_015915 [Adineta vaga]